jgi:hypothetical protein
MKNVSSLVTDLTKTAIRNKGFASAQIIYDWEAIVGGYLAKHTTPIKIAMPMNKNTDGVLHIQVVSSVAPIIQTLEPEIIEKIATYFGFKAVARIKLVHKAGF